MGLAVPRGINAATAMEKTAAMSHHAPMLRVDYGKLDDSVPRKERLSQAITTAVSTNSPLAKTVAMSDEVSRRISRLDSTIARLKGSLGRGSGSSGPESTAGGEPARIGSRLSTAERKVRIKCTDFHRWGTNVFFPLVFLNVYCEEYRYLIPVHYQFILCKCHLSNKDETKDLYFIIFSSPPFGNQIFSPSANTT